MASPGDPGRGDLDLLTPRHRSLRLRLEHILKGIARIEQLTAARTVQDYLADEGLREMIERNIARASEAPCPGRAQGGARRGRQCDPSRLDQIDDLVMWTTATGRLLPLKATVEAMLRALDVG